jgi:polyhydroxyalkanoate synthesis repressor PhaR
VNDAIGLLRRLEASKKREGYRSEIDLGEYPRRGIKMNEGRNMEANSNNTNNIQNAVVGQQAGPQTTYTNESGKVVKVIKRYQNRKLYDTHQSCYVTLDEIAEMIMRGEEVAVVDNRSKKDITSSTLTQIIFEKQKRSKVAIPVSTLRDIIQMGGGTFSGFLTKSAESGNSVLAKAKADLDRAFSRTENLRGAFQITQKAAEDLKRAIDEKAQNPGSSREVLNAAQNQLQNLSSQLNNIEKLIEAVEARSGNA